jgi:predicted secreted protein
MDRIAKFLILLVAALVLVPGCFAEETMVEPTEAPELIEEVIVEEEIIETANETVVEEAIVFDFTANETVNMLEMGVNQTVMVSLAADETAGIWNVSMSEGVELVGDSVVADGVQSWILTAATPGTYTFNAVFESIEETDAEPVTYNLEIIITEAVEEIPVVAEEIMVTEEVTLEATEAAN